MRTELTVVTAMPPPVLPDRAGPTGDDVDH
jgi:hypothetical protein